MSIDASVNTSTHQHQRGNETKMARKQETNWCCRTDFDSFGPPYCVGRGTQHNTQLVLHRSQAVEQWYRVVYPGGVRLRASPAFEHTDPSLGVLVCGWVFLATRRYRAPGSSHMLLQVCTYIRRSRVELVDSLVIHAAERLSRPSLVSCFAFLSLLPCPLFFPSCLSFLSSLEEQNYQSQQVYR